MASLGCNFFMYVIYAICNQQKAEEIIILEDDLKVSPDFFRYVASYYVVIFRKLLTVPVTFVYFIPCSYFSQTVHLLREDKSLYCISAWNDFVSSVGLLYSVVM